MAAKRVEGATAPAAARGQGQGEAQTPQQKGTQVVRREGELGAGRRTAERAAADLASWADSLPVLRERLPALGADLLAALSAGGGGLPCAAQAVRAALTLPPGFTRPTWQELWDGLRRARCRASPGISSEDGKERPPR